MMILITGATGHLGSQVIEFLLEKKDPASIAALVRDDSKAGDLIAKGVDVRVGNYEDKKSLEDAFEGIETLLLVSGNDVERRQQQHFNAINAAKKAGVQYVIYTSFDRKKEEGSPLGILAQGHINTDNHLKESGLDYTILRNTLYADALPMFLGGEVLEAGIFFPAGDGKVPFVTRRELAEATARILLTDGHKNKAYVLANTRSYSMHDIALMLSDIAGREVVYHNPPREIYVDQLVKASVPQPIIDAGAVFGDAIKTGEFETDHTDLPELLGREPLPLKDYLKALYTPV